MQIRIAVSEQHYNSVKEYLTAHGVEIDEKGEFMITEAERTHAFLTARNEKKEQVRLSAEEVVYIEAFGKDVEIHTAQDVFFAADRMYQLEEALDPKEFLRVSKSVIISRKHVKKIRPTLSQKFILTMTGGTLVDVTRSYYSDFRRFFNI